MTYARRPGPARPSFYSQLLNSFLLPVYDKVRGREYATRRRFLEESQWWPRERLLEFQWAELQTMIRHAWTTVPYYRRKYEQAGFRLEDIRSPEDFARLPILSRKEVNEHREELRSTAYRGKLLPSATGGSSGTPTRFYRTLESYDWRTAASDRAYSWTSCPLGVRTIYLWGAPVGEVARLQRWKAALHHRLQGHTVFPTFRQTPELWDGIERAFQRIRPPLAVGYVSSLENFARHLLERGRRLEGVHAVIAAAEPVYASTRELVAEAFGAPLFNTYGSREFMSIAGECDRREGLHIHCENLYVETESPGEASEILVTDLHNFGMPFLRYSIGDLGILDDRRCPCGRGLPMIRSIEGRVLDALRGADGRVVPGEWFPHLLKEVPEIREYMVEQKRLDLIVVSMVLAAELSEGSRSLLDREMRKVFGDSTRVVFERVAEIPMRASGKRRVTIGLPAE